MDEAPLIPSALKAVYPQPLPMDQGGLLSYSPDGSKVAYNVIFRNFRTWKRYTGGLAQWITIYDLKNNTSEDVPHTDWTDTFPMWHGNTIYFTSDRGSDHHLNLYSYDVGSKQIEQLTHYDEWDVMWPSLGPDAIVFQNAGYLYTFDFQSKQPKKLDIQLPADRTAAMKHWDNVSRLITDFDIAPDGKRAVFAARGDVFTVPAKEGSVRNLTRTPGIREKDVAWSPDGRWIAYVSDRTGEDEIYISPQDGLGKEQQITSGYKGFKFPPVWSPDSKKIAWADKDVNLWWIDIADKKPVKVDHDEFAEITNYNWSPDSKWLAYDKQGENNYVVRLSVFVGGLEVDGDYHADEQQLQRNFRPGRKISLLSLRSRFQRSSRQCGFRIRQSENHACVHRDPQQRRGRRHWVCRAMRPK